MVFPILILDMAASAAAVLLFLFAARSFVLGSNHEPLGWGFGIASGGILAYLLKDYVGGFGGGLRIGLGIILVLPALRALVEPGNTSILTAVIGLLIAFAVAGEPVKKLIHNFGPGTPESALSTTRSEIASLEKQSDRAKKILEELILQREELKRELKGLELPDEALLKHPRMQLLANTLEAQDKWERALTVIQKEIQSKGLRAQALEAGMEIERMTGENPDLVEILRDLDNTPKDPKKMDLIERTMLREKMQDVIDKELK